MVRFDREELAWAAGFFDGEGSTYLKVYATGRVEIRMAVAQTDPRPLVRFRNAVGIGSVNGPYERQNKTHKPNYEYRPDTFEHMQAVIAMLWHWLSEPKREQATTAFMAAKAYHERQRTQRDNPVCKRGHPMAGPEADVDQYTRSNGTPARRCRKCKNARLERQTETLRFALEGGSHGL
jgi:hypothetical protein